MVKMSLFADQCNVPGDSVRSVPTNTTTAVNTNTTDNNKIKLVANMKPGINYGNSASTSWAECEASLNESDFTVVTNKRRVKFTVTPRVKVLKVPKQPMAVHHRRQFAAYHGG